MATRHLRKLQQQLAQQQQAPSAASEEEESEEAEALPGKAPFNPFDLLTDDDEEAEAKSDGGEEDEQRKRAGEEEEQEGGDSGAQQRQQQQQPAATTSSSKKKKSKRKKKGGKGAAAPEEGSEQDDEHKDEKEEDIDAILQELNITPSETAAAAAAGGSGELAAAGRGGKGSTGARGTTAALLGVDVKRLRGDDELRRIFGSSVIEAVDRQDAAESSGGRGAGGRRYGWAPRNMPRRRPMKRGMLVAPRDDWPYYEQGTLSMESAGTAQDGTPMFRYVWPPAYRTAQHHFDQAQSSYDPNAVAAVLHQCPYHVDSLLAMSDLYRAMGEGQYAEESLNRLDIEVPENRALFVALFRHAQSLSRRGCHSSALEVAKLLLALDPGDPLGALQLVDYLALRAGRYSWLERFVEGFDGGAALALLPNYVYSLALARFWQEQQQQQRATAAAGASTSTAAAAAGDEDDSGGAAGAHPSSHDSLVSAMLLYPMVVPQLMARLQGQGVGKDSYWKSLLDRRLFKEAGDGGSATLSHLVSIFVERSHLLWKAADVQGWMRRAADAAADTADGKAAAAAASKSAAAPSSSGLPPLTAQDWAAVARESFPAGDANEFRHLRLSDFSDAVNALPREELAAAMEGQGGMAGLHDAMDEALLAQIQEAVQQAQEQQRHGGGQQRVSDQELQNTNPLMMLLRSLLPWVDAGQAPDYGAEEERGEEDGRG